MSSGSTGAGLSMDQPWEVIRWVQRMCRWSMREKMAYLVLYTKRSSAKPEPYPGVRALAEEMGTTKDAASEAVRQLQSLGALEIVHGGGRNGGNSYRLLPPWDALQEAPKKPRGRHVNMEERQSSKEGLSSDTGQSLNQGQSSNPGQSLIKAGLSSNQGQQLSSKQGHKEPIGRANEGANDSLAPATESPKPERRPRTSAGKKEPEQWNVLAQPLVQKLDTWLKLQKTAGVANWGAAVSMAAQALKGGKGPPIPPDEADAALDWGFDDAHWRRQLKARGMTALRDVWAAWTERGSPRGAGAVRYQDHNRFRNAAPDPWK